jgi:hypothetical protein
MNRSASVSASEGQRPRPRYSPTRYLGFLALGAGLLLPILSGCPGSLEGAFPPPPGMGGTGGAGGAGGAPVDCDAPTMVFAPKCSFCHPVLAQPDLTMNPPPNLAAVMTTMSPGCENMPIINAASPSSSVILKRISGTTCGNQMPLNLPALSPTEIDCVTNWVISNAQ